ncbi:MAG: hypothetical protein AAF401_14945, partial [Pseudomonadota bacterium]
IIDKIGKDISGAGMDPNVTGRSGEAGNNFGPTQIHRIVVRDLTEATEGSAVGIGMADLTTQRLVQKVDWSKTYVNLATAGAPLGGALPMVANSDQEALFLAMRSVPMASAEGVRAARIETTLDLSDIWVSSALAQEVEAHDSISIDSEAFDLSFDADGQLEHMAGAGHE